ncbi:MAG: hypothetical protein ACFFDW_05105 [Candidatus Thorarchaeota archaeon]
MAIIYMMLSPTGIVLTNASATENHDSKSSCDTNIPLVILDTFLVDLDKLYWYDNQTGRNMLLNEIGNGSYDWPLGPWGAHFTSYHVEGVDHLYFHPYRIIPIYAPHDGYFRPSGSELSNDMVILDNGTEVMRDCHIAIDLGLDCSIHIHHIDLLKTIYDEIQATGNYSFTEGEIIAYNQPNPPTNGFEIWYYAGWEIYGGGVSINPYLTFNSEIVNKITTYFNALLPRAKIAGIFPEAEMYNDQYVAINNTIWGVWEYSSGYLDSYFTGEDYYLYEGRITTLFNINFTNPEYYYRDPKNTDDNITEDVLGIFANNGGNEIEEFNATGYGFLREVEGDFTQGIMEIELNFYQDDWGYWYDTIYVRYSVESISSSFMDDNLTIECFYTLADAQAGFTTHNLTYCRYLLLQDRCQPKEPTSESSTTPTNSSNGYWLVAIPFVSILFYVVIKRKSTR